MITNYSNWTEEELLENEKLWAEENMNHHEPVIRKECVHNGLYFGSGDYYLICEECGRYWAMESGTTQSNIGKAAELSGERRVADLNTEV